MAGQTNPPIDTKTETIQGLVTASKNASALAAWTNNAYFVILLLAEIRDALVQRAE